MSSQTSPNEVPIASQEAGSAVNSNLGLIRQAEFEEFITRLNAGDRVLELGGGTGYQAHLLQSKGFQVRSVDIDNPKATIGRFFPVEIYNGKDLPVESGSVDVVISSNVLEHIPTLDFTMQEIKRVLTSDGRAIHILPSTVWRMYTTLARYPFMVKVALGLRKPGRGMAAVSNLSRSQKLLRVAKRIFFEPPHGEYPGALSELYYFSGKRWTSYFEKSGFEVIQRTGNHLLYTGYTTFPNLTIQSRQKLSRALGSSCHVFELRVRK